MSSKSRNPLLTFLLSYHVWVTSKNPSQLPVRKVLMILSYKLLKFSDYSCFRGQGIHCWYFYRAILFELPWKSIYLGQLLVQGCLKGILWIFRISSLFMFSRSRNPLLTFLMSYDVWMIQVNFQFERLVILSSKFLKFSHYSCFWGQGIHCWYFYIATMFRWPRKFR